MENKDRFRRLTEQRYRFAKTYVKEPHFYVVKEKLSPHLQRLYDEFKVYINAHGYTKRRGKRIYRYVDIGHHKYRMIENILNRSPLDEETLRKDLVGQERGGATIEEIVENWKIGVEKQNSNQYW